ncbi:MAG: MMPL family transporter, partial [Proteobacteria bacterium]|nr:MMPL family transporter [Pseudomonadota bacterium]
MHDLLSRALVAWVDLARRFALWVTLFALALSGASLFYAAGNLGINTSTGDMISKDVPYRRGWEDFKRAFPQFADTIVVVVDGESADIAEDAAAALARRLEAEKGLFRNVYWPGGDPYLRQNGLLYLSRDELSTLTDRLADAQPLLAELITDNSLRGLMEVLTEAAGEIAKGTEAGGGLVRLFDAMSATFEAETVGRPRNLGWREVMAGEAEDAGDRRRIIIVQAVERQGELLLGTGAIARIRALAGELGLVPAKGVRVRLTGTVPLDYEELLSAARGAANAAIISVFLVALLLFAGLRSPRLVLATLATLLMGLVWTAAFAALTVGHLNLISVGFAVLFVGLGVDFGIHFALRYREAIIGGADNASALREAAGGVGNALTLCAVAAAIGFFSFTGTDFVGLSELGVISGSSMFIALAANMTLMPAFLTLSPLKPARQGTLAANTFAARVPGWIETQVRLKAGKVLLGALALGIIAALVSSQVRFDFDPLHLKDPDSESVATFLELQRDDRTAGLSLSVLRGSLAEAVALAARLKGLEAVDSTRTLADFVPKDQDEKLAIIDDMALLFAPMLEAGTPKPAPTDAERRAAAAGGAFAEVDWFESEAEMLDDESIVAIASEGRNHESLGQTEAIVAAGKHVWYDKPAGDDWEHAQRVFAAAKKGSVHIQMGYMLRYHEGFRQVTEWARSGLLGDVFSVRAHMSTFLTPKAQQTIADSHEGGILYDLSGHMLDQIVWMLGRPVNVAAFLRNDSGQVAAFKDNCLGVYQFEAAIATVDIAAIETRPMARRFEVYGTRGSAIILEPF